MQENASLPPISPSQFNTEDVGNTFLLNIVNRLRGYVSCQFRINQHHHSHDNFNSQMFVFTFKETITDHRRTINPDYARDLIDSFLEEMELRNKQTDSTFDGKDQKNLLLLTCLLFSKHVVKIVTYYTEY